MVVVYLYFGWRIAGRGLCSSYFFKIFPLLNGCCAGAPGSPDDGVDRLCVSYVFDITWNYGTGNNQAAVGRQPVLI
jgi:hypothetical protein